MADQIHRCNIVTTRATRIGTRCVPPGYILAKVACRHPDEVLFLRQRLGWSHYRVDVDPATESAAATAATPAPAAEPAPGAGIIDDRAAAIACLRQINGIGPAIAARLVDHYRIPSRETLAAVLADPTGAAALEADPILRVSARDLSLWRRQLAAEADDDQDDDDQADDERPR